VTDSKTQQGLEPGHWLLAPIMAKDELVQIDLQVADGTVSQGHDGFRAFAQTASQWL
jgi:hypothetical protein